MGVAETALAAGFSSFIDKYNPEREKLWIVERFGKIVGSVAIVEKSKKIAQLRWLLVEPEARGLGLGHRLVQEAVAFSSEKRYRQIVLWSVKCLHKARRLYKEAGFELIKVKRNNSWGSDLVEEYWSKELY
ncbi:MAG: GNAT family N-acetyltransferase [Bdellovibrionales bacterium]|nr:GNAT family N-acetyltransferase [Bdellovibrionales bacterium]